MKAWPLLLLALAGCAPEVPKYYAIPPFEFTDEKGDRYHSEALEGKVWIASFIFTRCQGPCPTLTYRMQLLQDELPNDVHFVSFSVDPEFDTPEVLQAYAQKWKAQEGRWVFLTGEKKKLYDLAKDGFKAPNAEATEEGRRVFVHDPNLFLIDRDGHFRGRFNPDRQAESRRLVTQAMAVRAGPFAVLPHVNASLNLLSVILLVLGFILIKARRREMHKRVMLGACAVSVLFLISYLLYHFNHGATKFRGEGAVRTVYFAILISHTILAVAIIPPILLLLRNAFKGHFDRHRRLARWTLPAWLYVSVTGVAVYLMLYHVYT